jgi:proteasome beta subunit
VKAVVTPAAPLPRRRRGSDSATGLDLARSIFPVVTTVTGDGFKRLPEADVAEVAQRVIAGRMSSPDGPIATLRD